MSSEEKVEKNSSTEKKKEVIPFRPLSLEGSALAKEKDAETPDAGERAGKSAEEELLEKAYREGFEKGYSDGLAKVAEAAKRVESIIRELENYRGRKFQELLPEIVDLSLQIARRIIRREVSVQREVILGVVKDALKKVGEGETRVTIRVNPEDYEVLVANFEEVRNNGAVRNIEIEPSTTISPGGCYIETEGGDVDARVEEQLKEIENALRKAHD
ncbi:MAG: hypothetical protein D6713_08945 [Deltaproteobacteria bacterium]|nr:MAG: hypothetical protein D6713_08945 [Deltaproteobacteria bacterium]